MPYLTWIADEDLRAEVDKVLSTAERIMRSSEADFERNVIDPFSAMFQMSGFGIDYDTWYISESTRQAQKSLQNHVGDFHQNILGRVDGWSNLATGGVIDLVCIEKGVIAEVKNKYNTVKGANLSDLYDLLANNVMLKASLYRGFVAYYVTVIPRKPERFDKPFVPSDKSTGTRKPINQQIRVIDGASFYDMATGVPGSLSQLYNVLPQVIADCSAHVIEPDELAKLERYFAIAFGE